MDIGASTAIFLVVQVAICHAVPETQYCDNVCQQCDTVCSTQPNANGQDTFAPPRQIGPPGEKGFRGDFGLPGLNGPKGRRGPRGSPGSPDMKAIGELIEKRIQEALYGGSLQRGSPYRSCRDARYDPEREGSGASGLVNISIPALGQTEVYCDFTTDGGDWIVFQRRMDGSVDFYRDWDEYVHGFGDKNGEFWLGLEAIHQLTYRGKWEMRTELVTVNEEKFSVKYGQFRISPESDNYRLSLSSFSGNTSSSIKKGHGGQPFTTRDADHDNNPQQNCAIQWHGAWWYKDCGNLHSNLNGRYGSSGYDGVSWYKPPSTWSTMRYTEMKIRPTLLVD